FVLVILTQSEKLLTLLGLIWYTSSWFTTYTCTNQVSVLGSSQVCSSRNRFICQVLFFTLYAQGRNESYSCSQNRNDPSFLRRWHQVGSDCTAGWSLCSYSGKDCRDGRLQCCSDRFWRSQEASQASGRPPQKSQSQ